MIFTNLFKLIWRVFDILMFLAAAVVANVTAYNAGKLAFGICLTVTFVIAGLVSEFFGDQKGGDD